MTRAYPLEWPQGKPRCEARKSANFKITLPKALAELQRELDLMGAALSVLSTNLETRLDGLPRGGQANPADPGAALYFEWDGQRVCMAIDRFERVEHNIRAIGLSIAAIRGLERWGGDDLVRSAFTGFVALPPPISMPDQRHWTDVLNLPRVASRDQIQSAWKVAIRSVGGAESPAASAINVARDQALKEVVS